MPLDTARLKTKIKAAYTAAAAVSTNREDGLDVFAQALAAAIVDEIKELKIVYSSGLTAPNGPVSGTFNHTVQ
jgi:hypothetical protein